MNDSAFRAPLPCPKCSAASGRPLRVESRHADQVIVIIHCSQCAHEWSAERATPLFGEMKDKRTPPEEPA